ncbi:hypothetical protein MTO96_026559 [Rhipicephalus appendiculatus]
MGLSKSTQAKIPTAKVPRRMQTNELEGLHKPSSTPKVPLQSKAVFLVPTNSKGASCAAVQEHGKVDDATAGDWQIKMDANTLCDVKRENPPSGNVCFVVSPYGCGICSRSFEEVDALFSHVMACQWPEPFQCSLCSEPCVSWGAVQDHLAAHINSGVVKCPMCEHMFGKYLSIRRHIQRHHVPIRPFVCNCCDGTFITKSDIHKHSRQCRARTHVVDKYLGSSEKCDSQARSHLATTVYRCSVCPSAFLDRLVIARHMRVHLNQVQQSVVGEVQKKHPFRCGSHRSYSAGPPKVKQGFEAEASAECFIRIDIADKTTCCEAISKATQADLSSSAVSSWTQCNNLEDSEEDTS